MEDKDNIKKFIQDNLQDFNSEQPSSKVWDKVQKRKNPNHFKQYIGIAASILLLITVGTYFLFQDRNDVDPQNHFVEKALQKTINVELSEEVQEMEQFYGTQVNQKIKKAKKYKGSQDLLQEVTNLKDEFDELKNDMDVGANRSIVLEAMIDNYRIRLMILEDLLEELENSDTQKEL